MRADKFTYDVNPLSSKLKPMWTLFYHALDRACCRIALECKCQPVAELWKAEPVVKLSSAGIRSELMK